MSWTPRQRWMVLGSLLLATVTAVLLVDDAAEEPAPAPRAARHKPPATATAAVTPPAGTGMAGDETPAAEPPFNPFRSRSWHVEPPPPPPPKPTAPPLPFKYLGKLVEDGESRIFLAHRERHLIARVGERLAAQYVVETIDEQRLGIRYLPLDELQTLNIGGAN